MLIYWASTLGKTLLLGGSSRATNINKLVFSWNWLSLKNNHQAVQKKIFLSCCCCCCHLVQSLNTWHWALYSSTFSPLLFSLHSFLSDSSSWNMAVRRLFLCSHFREAFKKLHMLAPVYFSNLFYYSLLLTLASANKAQGLISVLFFLVPTARWRFD